MIRWEYCQLELTKGRKVRNVYQAYYSSQARADNVDLARERHVFTSWRDALNYLGNAGWEAFHIDAKGVWYFKQPVDQDEDTDASKTL
jgi:hypothetical protein